MKIIKPVYETVSGNVSPRVYSMGKSKICEVAVTVKRRSKSSGAQVSKNLDTIYALRKQKFDSIDAQFKELCSQYNKTRM